MHQHNKLFVNSSFIFLLFIGLLFGLFSGDLINYYDELPLFYILATGFLLALSLEALLKTNQPWSIPSLIVYTTVAIWYLTELLYWSPEKYTNQFSHEIIEYGYFQVVLFLVSFRFFVAKLSKKFTYNKKNKHQLLSTSFNPNRLLLYLSLIWLVLLLYGISRMNGNIVGTLFPLASRAGVHMWQRAAVNAGSSGFIVSSAAYIYLLVCSFFGVILTLQKKRNANLTNIVLILISWPYFFLVGSRKQVLVLVFPAIFSYALISKHKWWFKIFVLALSLIALNYALTLIIAYRNVGFGDLLNQVGQEGSYELEQKHNGLNMMEELFFVNSFYERGILQLKYGGGYLAEFLNFVPRAIWPGKPLVNVDYAILRGFGRSGTDLGVFATISPGCIGQGIINFGPEFGPLASALILALWAAFLGRLWTQRYSTPRLCLFMAGLGTTFNLGRGISLLSLWPIVFGYVFVRIFEYFEQKKIYASRIDN